MNRRLLSMLLGVHRALVSWKSEASVSVTKWLGSAAHGFQLFIGICTLPLKLLYYYYRVTQAHDTDMHMCYVRKDFREAKAMRTSKNGIIQKSGTHLYCRFNIICGIPNEKLRDYSPNAPLGSWPSLIISEMVNFPLLSRFHPFPHKMRYSIRSNIWSLTHLMSSVPCYTIS